MLYPYGAYAYGDDLVAAGPAVDLSVGSVPSGTPGPAAPSSYHHWHGREILMCEGGLTQV